MAPLGYRLPSFGTFSTSLKPSYFFGIPQRVKMAGIRVNIDFLNKSLWALDSDKSITVAIAQQLGMMASALEHRIPEMLFTDEEHPGEAVSAVKALAVAAKEGQRVYTVTAKNVDSVLPVLNVRADVKDDIRNAVAIGKIATISQNQVSVGGWTGVGYIIIDPNIGTGAYMISGGSNGGVFNGPQVGALFGLTLIFSGAALGVLGMYLSGILLIFYALHMVVLGFLMYYLGEPDAPFNINCGLEILDEVLALLLMTGPFWKGEKALRIVAQAFALIYGAKHFLSKFPSEKCPIDI